MTICERVYDCLDKQLWTNPSKMAKAIGISKSHATQWKVRNSDPPAKLIVPIAEYLGVSPIYLLTGEEQLQDFATTITEEESRIIKKYRSLDEDGKDAVRGILLQEQRRCESESTSGERDIG